MEPGLGKRAARPVPFSATLPARARGPASLERGNATHCNRRPATVPARGRTKEPRARIPVTLEAARPVRPTPRSATPYSRRSATVAAFGKTKARRAASYATRRVAPVRAAARKARSNVVCCNLSSATVTAHGSPWAPPARSFVMGEPAVLALLPPSNATDCNHRSVAQRAVGKAAAAPAHTFAARALARARVAAHRVRSNAINSSRKYATRPAHG